MDSLNLDSQLSIIKARCPSCYKLYAVDAAEIYEAKPQFACSKCNTRFWFPFPESLEQKEILGFPVEWLNGGQAAAPTDPSVISTIDPASAGTPALDPAASLVGAPMFNCPRCQSPYAAGDSECPKCGVVFAKLEMLETPGASSISSSPALRRQWHHVMDDYANLDAHRKFIQMAQREGKLDFASSQYRRLLSAHSGDETALRMQKEIVALVQATPDLVSKSQPLRLMKLMPKITTVALVGGGALIGFGLMIEAARNLIGLGVAVVFFTLAAGWIINR